MFLTVPTDVYMQVCQTQMLETGVKKIAFIMWWRKRCLIRATGGAAQTRLTLTSGEKLSDVLGFESVCPLHLNELFRGQNHSTVRLLVIRDLFVQIFKSAHGFDLPRADVAITKQNNKPKSIN